MSRPSIRKEKFDQIIGEVWAEYLFAVHKFPSFDGEPEALHQIERQYLQLMNANLIDKYKAKQAIELMAMCIRYLIDCGKI